MTAEDCQERRGELQGLGNLWQSAVRAGNIRESQPFPLVLVIGIVWLGNESLRCDFVTAVKCGEGFPLEDGLELFSEFKGGKQLLSCWVSTSRAFHRKHKNCRALGRALGGEQDGPASPEV